MEHHSSITQQATVDTFTEKRGKHRCRVLKSGTLTFNKGYSSFGCRIKNLSADGALLEMGETTGIPNQFTFHLDNDLCVPARIIWRTQNRIGIKF